VLVTGAAGGIGRAIVAELERAGASVAACDLRDAPITFDQRDPDAARAGVEEAVAQLGGLDAVIANAGVVDTLHRSDRFPAEAWAKDIEANLTGAFHVVQAAFPALKAGEAPAIVFVSSASAELGLPGQAAYTASKAGLVGLARTLAAEWGPLGIRVNVVMPGLIATPKVRALPEQLLDDLSDPARPHRRAGGRRADDRVPRRPRLRVRPRPGAAHRRRARPLDGLAGDGRPLAAEGAQEVARQQRDVAEDHADL
jgi:NAD(P)-dependent dehydrogenase (short-subunit alcohol dehydrogenase family)